MENKFNIENLELYYGNFKALKNINMGIKELIISLIIYQSTYIVPATVAIRN